MIFFLLKIRVGKKFTFNQNSHFDSTFENHENLYAKSLFEINQCNESYFKLDF